MTNDEVRALLRDCRERLKSAYPIPEGSDVDARLAMTIGLCLGAIYEGLAAEREGRPMKINNLAQSPPGSAA
jgi:hypothetical protein